MSGIAGIIHMDGKPIEPGLIEKMTGAMAHRGPDGIHHWVKGSVALGQCLLNDSAGSLDAAQPLTRDGLVWIVADARIDARQALLSDLRLAGRRLVDAATDVELILEAYAVFGDAFLHHLLGDFAFAIWDSRHAKLICARDHFGVRPLFYAKTNKSFFVTIQVQLA